MLDRSKLPNLGWKQKIDPAFAKFIKSHLKLLDVLGLRASEGYIQIGTLETSKIVDRGYPSLETFYEDRGFSDLVSLLTANLPESPALNEMPPMLKKLENKEWGKNIKKELTEMCEPLPEESRDYYLKWDIMPDPNMDFQAFIHFTSDLVSLMSHLSTIEMNNDDSGFENVDITLIQRILFGVIVIISTSIHKKSIFELYDEARKGDDSSLFKVIQLDKSLFDHEWVRSRLRRAMYLGDRQFFISLANAMKADPLKHRKIKIERHLVLMHFWFAGLYRLTIPELIQLLEESGIHIPEDAVTFRKFIDREIRPYYKKLHGIYRQASIPDNYNMDKSD